MSMKTRNITKVFGLVCTSIMVNLVNISFTIGDEIMDTFSNVGYKPVPDTFSYVKDGGELNDNFLYKEWCEETFNNGNCVYEAYKNIAFNIEYTEEPYKTDIWQTPLETAKLGKGDCEDVVFHFFSQLPLNMGNAEIVWGRIFDSRRDYSHVWYQLTSKTGQLYVVEGFSKDWNGIIPMGIVENTETRRPIFTIAHSSVSRLASSVPKVDDSQNIRSLFLPNLNREISNILNKLNGLFSRYERQKEVVNMQVAYKSN